MINLKANEIKVDYVSKFTEGDVYSEAVLSLIDGTFVAIESDSTGENYAIHIKDQGFIGLSSGNFAFDVIDVNGKYQVADAKALDTLRHSARFAILTGELGGFVENSTDEQCSPIYYSSLSEAVEELEDMLLSVREAVAEGDMEEEYDPSECRIRSVEDNNIIEFAWDPKREDKLIAIDASKIYLLDADQPMTCPACGSRTDFVDTPGGLQYHTCLNASCGKTFLTAEDDQPFSASSMTFSVMLADDAVQTYTWSGVADSPEAAIELAVEEMNASRGSEDDDSKLSRQDVRVLFVAEGEVKYCTYGDGEI